MAVLYYTSQYFNWWDFGGMTIQNPKMGGIGLVFLTDETRRYGFPILPLLCPPPSPRNFGQVSGSAIITFAHEKFWSNSLLKDILVCNFPIVMHYFVCHLWSLVKTGLFGSIDVN